MRTSKVERVPRLYRTWHNMKQRCYNPKAKGYRWYGGKGITVCDEWRNCFVAFQAWALENGYADNLTIDRIDSNKGYQPGNCRWIPGPENAARGRSCSRDELFRKYPIRFCRSIKGITRQKLSEMSGVPVEEIKRAEESEIGPRNMTAKNLFAIADALGVDPHILLEG